MNIQRQITVTFNESTIYSGILGVLGIGYVEYQFSERDKKYAILEDKLIKTLNDLKVNVDEVKTGLNAQKDLISAQKDEILAQSIESAPLVQNKTFLSFFYDNPYIVNTLIIVVSVAAIGYVGLKAYDGFSQSGIGQLCSALDNQLKNFVIYINGKPGKPGSGSDFFIQGDVSNTISKINPTDSVNLTNSIISIDQSSVNVDPALFNHKVNLSKSGGELTEMVIQGNFYVKKEPVVSEVVSSNIIIVPSNPTEGSFDVTTSSAPSSPVVSSPCSSSSYYSSSSSSSENVSVENVAVDVHVESLSPLQNPSAMMDHLAIEVINSNPDFLSKLDEFNNIIESSSPF